MLNILFPLLDGAPATGQPGVGGGSSMLIFILLMILIFYFFMIRPQQKKQKKIEEARNSLQKGDKVVTIGGIQRSHAEPIQERQQGGGKEGKRVNNGRRQ